MSEKAVILIVDNEQNDLESIRAYLKKNYPNVNVLKTSDGVFACQTAFNRIPDLIVATSEVPNMGGVIFLEELQLDKKTSDIPVLIVFEENDIEQWTRFVQAGAKDFVSLPIDFNTLSIRLKLLLDLSQAVQKAKLQRQVIDIQQKEVQQKKDQILILKENVDRQDKLIRTAYGQLEDRKHELEAKEVEINFINEALQKASENFNEDSVNLQILRNDLQENMRYAYKVQRAVLPSEEKMAGFFLEYFVIFKPQNTVSGDFYWINYHEKKKIVAVVDCTGRGISGAFMTMIGMMQLNWIVNKEKISEPDQILQHLSRSIRNSLRQEDPSLADRIEIALCTIDETTKMLTFSGANNHLLVIQNGQSVILKASRARISGLADKQEPVFEKQTLQLQPNDALYIFTDGFADQVSTMRIKFSRERLLRLLQEIHTEPMTEQKKIINENIEKWQQKMPQIDDMLMIGFRA